MKKIIIVLVLSILSIILPLSGMATEKIVKVGVLANRGYEQCQKRWGPTINYLAKEVAPYKFQLIPLSYNEILSAVQNRNIDFVICNPAIFVDIEALYNVTAIATLKNLLLNGGYTFFGGVIFTRAGNNSIRTIYDLKGKTFVAADRESLGGWQVQWRELKKAGLDPYKDFAKLYFLGQHDAVVLEVLKGKADAGACRTDVLESLAKAGKINLGDLNVLAEGSDVQMAKNEFPLLISTRLYPEWAFAKLSHTSPQIASRVSLALQGMKRDSPAAIAGEYAGWSYPLNYKSVHELQRELQIGYYKRLTSTGVKEVIQKYWKEIAIAILLFIVTTTALISLSILYRRLSVLKEKLAVELQKKIEIEEELRQANSKLESYATTDALTQVANRRKFDDRYDEEWRRMAREQKPLSLILADIDHFKKYNDHYGHQDGDKCLYRVAQEAGQYIGRPGDFIARYGGEEFVIVLPSTDNTSAVMIAERIRIAIESLKLPHEASPVSPYVTLSIGVATMNPGIDNSPGELLKAADIALYTAKKQGRNRVSS